MNDHIVYAPYYLPQTHSQYQKDDDFFISRVTDYLKLINPDLTEDDIKSVRVFRYKYAQPICGPQYLETLPDIDQGNGIYIADTSHYYPEDRSISESIRLARAIATQVDANA